MILLGPVTVKGSFVGSSVPAVCIFSAAIVKVPSTKSPGGGEPKST